CQQGSSYPLTF
nr:immunoglobulin light chain junction region [Macaca mulatta]